MKIRLTLLALFLATQSTQAASILSASNISEEKIALTLSTDDARKPRNLFLLRLNDQRIQNLPWPEKIGQEEIMGLLLFPKRLLLISQWTAGDGKFPHIHQYDLASEKWRTIGELKCKSFETVEVKNGSLNVDCEADPQTEEKAQKKSISLPNKGESISLTLPIEKTADGKKNIVLKGSLFSWDALEITSGKKVTTITANELLKKR